MPKRSRAWNGHQWLEVGSEVIAWRIRHDHRYDRLEGVVEALAKRNIRVRTKAGQLIWLRPESVELAEREEERG